VNATAVGSQVVGRNAKLAFAARWVRTARKTLPSDRTVAGLQSREREASPAELFSDGGVQ
jgi:hypothetical protein